MKIYSPTYLALFTSILLLSCVQTETPTNMDSAIPTHYLWDSLLQQHVDDSGMVHYKAFSYDTTSLNLYINSLINNPPSDSWSPDDKLAYWINLYNAATIKLITQHYLVTSIKDIGSSIQIPFVNTPWQIEFIKFGNQSVDLDYIEHTVIRKQFDEPRIHFTLVCAAISCPKLRNEAYQGDRLEQQLTDQTKIFLTDNTKNNIAKNNIELSKIFWWYGGDFKKKGSLIDFLNQYSSVQIDQNAEIDYKDYDWRLNEQ